MAIKKDTKSTPHDRVKIRVHRNKNEQSKGVFVNVNNHSFFVPYGQTVEVPKYIAEVLERSMAQDEATAAMLETMSENSRF